MRFLHSFNSVTLFFLGLLGLTFASFLFFAPSASLGERTMGNVPKIELTDFNMYQMNRNSTEMKVQGSGALQFEDYEILYGFLASRSSPDSKKAYEYVSGDEVFRHGDVYDFPKGAVYTKSDGGSFWSQGGSYDYRTEVFKGKGDFVMTSLQGNFKGKNVFYDRKKGVIKAIDVVARIPLDTAGKEKTR